MNRIRHFLQICEIALLVMALLVAFGLLGVLLWRLLSGLWGDLSCVLKFFGTIYIFLIVAVYAFDLYTDRMFNQEDGEDGRRR